MTVTSGKINLQRKHDLISHVTKVKAATSAHSMADVKPFLSNISNMRESVSSHFQTPRRELKIYDG